MRRCGYVMASGGAVVDVGQCDGDGMVGKHEVRALLFEHRAEIQFHATAFYVKTNASTSSHDLKPTRRGHVSPHGHA